MDRSKSKHSSKKGFERKQSNGKENPKYVDILEIDKPIAGQNFVCMSFVSPEKVLKQKDVFFFEEFLKNWEFNKSMEKFLQFVNFISFKYNVSFEDLNKDFKDFVQEEKENLIKSSLDDDYKTYLDNHEDELQKKFDIANNFQTSTRGLKVRGVYPTQEEAELLYDEYEHCSSLPSGRSMWCGGTEWSGLQANFEGSYNFAGHVVDDISVFGRIMDISMNFNTTFR
jgi:hypothetical protein